MHVNIFLLQGNTALKKEMKLNGKKNNNIMEKDIFVRINLP